MKYYVIINGESSLDIEGLAIESLPAISKPLMRSKREEIDGRNGDIITQLGFSAYDKTLKIGLWGNYDIDEIISYFNQDGIITFSNEPDMYYNFTILNRIDFINQLEAFRKATITIHCQPFKYKEEETQTLELEEHQEEGTSFNLEGTIEAPMQIDLKGNTSQVQLSGKNLYIPIVWTKTHNQVSYTFYNNGSILVNGTANSASFSMYTSEATSYMQYLDAGTYTLSGGSIKVQLKILDESGNAITNTTTSQTTATFTLNSRIKIWLRCEVANTIQVNNEIIRPMIEKGSTATSYEQYCGGVPSPNPSYPQDIHNVSGNNNIVVCGKNLCNVLDQTKTVATNMNVSVSNQIITFNGSWSGGGNWVEIDTKFSLGAGTYKLSKDTTISNFTTSGMYDSISQTWVSFTTADNFILTLNNPVNITKVRGWTNGLGTLNNATYKIQIEKGSTATTYEAYNGTTYPINLPVQGYNTPNLYDPTTAPVIDGCMAVKSVMKLHGVSLTKIKTTYMACNQNTKYLITKTLGGTNYFDVGTTTNTPAINGSLNQCEDAITETSYEITTGANDNYIVVSYWQDSETGDTKGSITIKEYSTKKEELSKIGTYQDYIYKENDKWYLHKEIGKVVLDGSENWATSGATVPSGVSAYSNGTNSGFISNTQGYSNLFTIIDNATEWNAPSGNGTARYTSNQLYIKILTSIASDVNALKTWLGNNNIIMYGILATPTNTEITDTTLIEQLEAIYNAKSKNGETNINQVNNDEMFILGVDYFTGTNSITITNHGNYYSKPKLTLTGTGNIGIYLNDNQIFQVALGTNETIIIDTDKMEAYYESTLKNRQVIGDYNSFKLLSGENTIRISGTFSKLQVDNYSRWI